jgi:hypothetical protein
VVEVVVKIIARLRIMVNVKIVVDVIIKNEKCTKKVRADTIPDLRF